MQLRVRNSRATVTFAGELSAAGGDRDFFRPSGTRGGGWAHAYFFCSYGHECRDLRVTPSQGYCSSIAAPISERPYWIGSQNCCEAIMADDALTRAFHEILVNRKPTAQLSDQEREQVDRQLQSDISPRLERIREEQRMAYDRCNITLK